MSEHSHTEHHDHHDHHDHHEHHDHHQHDHQAGEEQDGTVLSDLDLTVRSLESLLVAKGYVDPATIDTVIEIYEHEVGPHLGARVVARAWTDPDFKAWLLRDATAAIASLDISGRQGEHMVALEARPEQHHVVVCTLCSCYPWPVLGLPPRWYKSAPYRSRVVIDPRGVLAEFGVTLPESTAIRVWDSTAEVRYLVVPLRPAGTEGWTEEELAAIVTRDAMIGTGVVTVPSQPSAVAGSST